MVTIGGTKDSIPQNADGDPYSVQNPLPTDGDRVYSKDIWIEESDMNTFSGLVTDLFDNLHSLNIDSTSNNPKEIFIHFNATTPTTVIGIGSHGGGDFSNIKITALVSGPIEFNLYDGSADATKLTSLQVDLDSVGFNAIRIQFHTTDTVTLSNIFIAKARSVVARITGQKPDGSFIEFQSTQAGNFKMSLEELENDVSVNNNTQLRTTLFASDGTEFDQDSMTGAFVTTSYAHHKIHTGDHFFNKDWADLANGATYDILVSVADTTKWPHFLFAIGFEAEANVTLYAGTTTSNDGTPLLVVNRNGNSGTANGLLAFHSPTITDIGTPIARYKGGSGKQVEGRVRSSSEQILTQNAKFLARIINDTTSNNWVDWLLDWYEKTSI